jgi:hypothetical protein
VSQTRGTGRNLKGTQGHDDSENQVQEDTGGPEGLQKHTPPRRFGTVRPRVSNPGPPTNFEFKIADFGRRRKTGGHSRVTDFLGTWPRQTRSNGLRTVD